MSESSFYLNANPIKCRFTIPRSQTLPTGCIEGPLTSEFNPDETGTTQKEGGASFWDQPEPLSLCLFEKAKYLLVHDIIACQNIKLSIITLL